MQRPNLASGSSSYFIKLSSDSFVPAEALCHCISKTFMLLTLVCSFNQEALFSLFMKPLNVIGHRRRTEMNINIVPSVLPLPKTSLNLERTMNAKIHPITRYVKMHTLKFEIDSILIIDFDSQLHVFNGRIYS